MLPVTTFQHDPKKETPKWLKGRVDDMQQEMNGLMVARAAIEQEIMRREQLIAQYVSELLERKDECEA